MNWRHKNGSRPRSYRAGSLALRVCASGVCVAVLSVVAATAASEPASPRETYNQGTHLLREGKLREAEAALESALLSQRQELQPPALYNLGHVRFRQGEDELRKEPADTPKRARSVTGLAAGAITEAEEALKSEELRRLISAYLRGRGVRREMKLARAAVQRALETYGVALGKWERSSADFRSAMELDPADRDARSNAEIVDRNIARLVDRLTLMQQMLQGMSDQQQQLTEKLKELKGKIPAQDMPPGEGGDEDEEMQEQPRGPEQGQQEPSGREGKEMSLSPEQAAWLLEGYRLDGERKLPMGNNGQSEPKPRKGLDW